MTGNTDMHQLVTETVTVPPCSAAHSMHQFWKPWLVSVYICPLFSIVWVGHCSHVCWPTKYLCFVVSGFKLCVLCNCYYVSCLFIRGLPSLFYLGYIPVFLYTCLFCASSLCLFMVCCIFGWSIKTPYYVFLRLSPIIYTTRQMP
jgi:hypothetical protein